MGRFNGFVLLACFCCVSTVMAEDSSDAESRVVLQILGSGGPSGQDKRASSGNLVWVNGSARVMIDAGGGTYLRFQQSEARPQDLRLLGFTHFHPDHASELPALVWSGIGRRSELVISGPEGKGDLPGVVAFLNTQFNEERGAFPWLASSLEEFIKPVAVDLQSETPFLVYEVDDLKVTAIAVPHGNLPAVGYRVDVGGVSIGFSGAQNGTSPAFIELVRDVDVLVMHFAVPEGGAGRGGRSNQLHARPSVVGKVA